MLHEAANGICSMVIPIWVVVSPTGWGQWRVSTSRLPVVFSFEPHWIYIFYISFFWWRILEHWQHLSFCGLDQWHILTQPNSPLHWNERFSNKECRFLQETWRLPCTPEWKEFPWYLNKESCGMTIILCAAASPKSFGIIHLLLNPFKY